MPLFVVAIFSGYWQLNAMLDAKTRKLKGLRKESGKVRIKLLSFFYLGRDRILLGASGEARVVREWKRGDRGLIARDCSKQAVHFRLEVRQRTAEAQRGIEALPNGAKHSLTISN
jgi:hypothetical protein